MHSDEIILLLREIAVEALVREKDETIGELLELLERPPVCPVRQKAERLGVTESSVRRSYGGCPL